MAEETELQEPKEYKVLVNATNGLFPADNGSLHLSKEQAKAKWEQLLNDGTNPDDIKIVWQDDPRFPTDEVNAGFVPPPT